MTPDVTQWLAEIKTLQHQLAEAWRDREAADASAMNWRKLYETESQQRRTDVMLHRQAVALLDAEIRKLQTSSQVDTSSRISESAIEQAIEQLATTDELRESLKTALLECDRLRNEVDRLGQVLAVEQANHDQTRKSLTTALSDAVDQLTKERMG